MKKYILLGLILLPAGFFTHAMLAFLTLDKDKHAEFSARQAQRRAQEATLVAAYVAKLEDVAKKIPDAPGTAEQTCPPGVPSPIPHAAAEADFFKHFASRAYAKIQKPKIGYRSKPFEALAENLSLEKPEDRDTSDMADAARSLEKTPYFLVFYPTQGIAEPVIDKDIKGYIPGYFTGWQVLVDASTGKNLCQTALHATNSPKVSFRKTRLVRVITVHDNLQKKLEEDLSDNFRKAVEQGLNKMKGTP